MNSEQGRLFDPPPRSHRIPAAPDGKPDPARYFVVLVPAVGDVNVLAFDKLPEFCQSLYEWKLRRTAGRYTGDILAFHGHQLEHTQFVGSMRIKLSDGQQVTMQDTSQFQYEGSEYLVDPE